MKLITFCLITALALFYAGLTLTESNQYQIWEKALKDQRELQKKLEFYQRLNAFTEQLLRRMAVDSQKDPQLAQLLKDNRIKVVVAAPEPMKEPPGNDSTATPAANVAPAPAPAAPTSNPSTPAPAHP